MILGHYLIVQRWHPELFPNEDELKRVAVWVRVPGLPIEYYDKHILWSIGNCLGRTVKIDPNTLKSKRGSEIYFYVPERGRFAHICIEIDLRKILRSKFELNGRIYKVEYEGLNLVCFSCGRYGHQREVCPLLVENNVQQKVAEDPAVGQSDKESSTNHGPWMLVQNQRRHKTRI